MGQEKVEMKIITKNIPIKLNFFGFAKPQHKQSFLDDISKMVIDACNAVEGNENLRAKDVIYIAGDAAISLITDIWENPDKLVYVRGNITVCFKFNNDYTDWQVIVRYTTQQDYAESPNFDNAIEEEYKELFDRYGFKKETDNRQWVVSYRGMTAEMNSEKLMKFKEEVGPGVHLIVQEKTND